MPVTETTDSEDQLKKELNLLDQQIGSLQRQATQRKIPVIILFEGADGAGKGELINRVLQSLDPRGFKVHTMHSPSEESFYRPFLWRFWTRTPARGRITIFDRSWYRLLLDDRVNGDIADKQVPKVVREIRNFEQQLTDDGVVLIKVYLTISEERQEERLTQLAKNPATSWRVTDKDWKRHELYDEYRAKTEEMIHLTHAKSAPWARIDSTNFKEANVELLKFVNGQLQTAIERRKAPKIPKVDPDLDWIPRDKYPSPLDKVDLSPTLDKEKYRTKRNKLQDRLHELEHELYIHRRPVVLVFEGWDAAGKGGAIRRLTKGLDPRGYEVIPVAAPNDLEKSHHYMWRFWTQFPKAGHIAIYDRSWYGRVMVERLEGFCSQAEWKRAYDEINETEEHWTNGGTILLKFWIHIDPEEQLSRFKAREANPVKRWKITDEDWRNREKWERYKIAVEDMINLTNKPNAPWVVVEGNNKPFARIKVLETTVKAIEQAL
ncbi:MAG: polyphosphate:AMP phosphotransferase [Verrucomicrobiae bacterium]|nr:polyphosphate:AMP phosphotransferase [Verrucomicrobiae bacterium]